MSRTLEVSEKVFERAQRVADATHAGVEQVLNRALEAAFPSLVELGVESAPIQDLSDEDVLQLTRLRMERSSAERLSELLAERKERSLSASEQQEFLQLMGTYETLLLRQSEAIEEAGRRNLLHPQA